MTVWYKNNVIFKICKREQYHTQPGLSENSVNNNFTCNKLDVANAQIKKI